MAGDNWLYYAFYSFGKRDRRLHGHECLKNNHGQAMIRKIIQFIWRGRGGEIGYINPVTGRAAVKTILKK
jgi:hypothetical protein